MLWGMGGLLLPGPQGSGHSVSAESPAPPSRPGDPADPHADGL